MQEEILNLIAVTSNTIYIIWLLRDVGVGTNVNSCATYNR